MLAPREARSLGHDYVGTEHILLGLMRENDDVVDRVLLAFNVDSEKIRSELIRMVRSPRAAPEGAWGTA